MTRVQEGNQTLDTNETVVLGWVTSKLKPNSPSNPNSVIPMHEGAGMVESNPKKVSSKDYNKYAATKPIVDSAPAAPAQPKAQPSPKSGSKGASGPAKSSSAPKGKATPKTGPVAPTGKATPKTGPAAPTGKGDPEDWTCEAEQGEATPKTVVLRRRRARRPRRLRPAAPSGAKATLC